MFVSMTFGKYYHDPFYQQGNWGPGKLSYISKLQRAQILMQAGLNSSLGPLTLSHLLWEPKLNCWSFLIICWRWNSGSRKYVCMYVCMYVWQELSYPWSVCDINSAWHVHGLVETLCQIHQIWWPWWGSRERGQTWGRLYKKRYPGEKAPLGKPEIAPWSLPFLLHLCTLVETRMAHTCSLSWEKKRQVCLCLFSNQTISPSSVIFHSMVIRVSDISGRSQYKSIHPPPSTDQCLFIDAYLCTQLWGNYKVFPL